MVMNGKISLAARILAISMVAALALAGSAMGEVSRAGLVAEYHFDGDAKDSSGNGNDASISGAKFVQGISGQALSFNGVNSYVKITSNNFKLQPISVELWIKTTEIESTVIDYENGNGYYGWELYTVKGGYARFNLLSSGGGSRADVYSSTSIIDNLWHHVVATDDGVNLKIYVDGNFDSSSSSSTSVWTTTMYSYLGATRPENKNALRWFNGFIDEVRIYNRALSDNEVKANYEASKAPPPPQLALTKSLSPSTITEGDSTTVTIRVENTGGDAKSVKITDIIPQGFALVSGAASQEYATLKSTESRSFQYTIKATGTGRFVSDLATITYQDEKGNSYSGASNSATITVQAGAAQAPPQTQQPAQAKTPGFEGIMAIAGLISVLLILRNKHR